MAAASSNNAGGAKVTDAAISVAALGPAGMQLAFSPNNHRILIANVDPTKDCANWTIATVLDSQHMQPISGISWHHGKNRIITCAHDRTAFVWDFDETSGQWAPSVVMLDAVMTKGCTACNFAASGDRTLVASAHSAIAVGKYSNRLLWYTCKFMTPHTASVTCMAPHPTSDTIMASGSTDCTVRVTCIDTSNKIPEGQPQFGQVLKCFNVGAWVHSLQFLPGAASLVVALHSSAIMIISGSTEDASTMTSWAPSAVVNTPGLPFTRIAALNDDTIVAGGFDFFPVRLSKVSDTEWKENGAGKQPKAAAKELSETEKARLRFQSEATLGQATAVELPKTRHSNTLTSVVAFPSGGPAGFMFLTTGLDGRVESWKEADLINE